MRNKNLTNCPTVLTRIVEYFFCFYQLLNEKLDEIIIHYKYARTQNGKKNFSLFFNENNDFHRMNIFE